LAFPCDQFGGQEPDAIDAIVTNTAQTYGRPFRLFATVDVRGPDADPLYVWLNEREEHITWNFHKFLIDRSGRLRGSYKPKMSPLELEADIVKLLDEEPATRAKY